MSARHQFVEQYDWSKKFVELGHFDLGAYKCQTPGENNGIKYRHPLGERYMAKISKKVLHKNVQRPPGCVAKALSTFKLGVLFPAANMFLLLAAVVAQHGEWAVFVGRCGCTT